MSINIDLIIDNVIGTRAYEQTTDLCTIMKNSGSDKGLGWHNYTTLYEPLLSHLKTMEDVHVFEVGIGTNNPDLPSSMGVGGVPGASLRGWSTWLPNARISGADIDEDIMFTTDKITTYTVDQLNPTTIEQMWCRDSLRETLFDVIIDDGLHLFGANDQFLTLSHHKLKNTGVYIVEDILPHEIHLFAQSIPKYLQWFRQGRIVALPNPKNYSNDNNLLILVK